MKIFQVNNVLEILIFRYKEEPKKKLKYICDYHKKKS